MADSIYKNSNVNWPNALTVIRIIMALMVPFYMFKYTWQMQLVAGVIFTIAAITDYLDGYFARKYGLITIFGKLADPIADKLLTLGAFSIISFLGLFPAWILVPILIREIGITLLRFYFLYKGTAVQAVKSGKQKTALQITAIGFGFASYMFDRYVLMQFPSTATPVFSSIFLWGFYLFLAWAFYQTIYSGYDFMRLNWDRLFPKK